MVHIITFKPGDQPRVSWCYALMHVHVVLGEHVGADVLQQVAMLAGWNSMVVVDLVVKPALAQFPLGNDGVAATVIAARSSASPGTTGCPGIVAGHSSSACFHADFFNSPLRGVSPRH